MNATVRSPETGVEPQLLAFSGDQGVRVDLPRLVSSRLLVQANSGGGKSRALRYLLERTYGEVQHLVFDPEGEFASLRERYDYVLVGAEGDVPAETGTAVALCRRLFELNANAVINLYDLTLRERRRYVRLFIETMMHLPREMWRPVLVVMDEIQVFAPERNAGEAESTDAVIALATQGRKRGFALCGATQRLSRLHKDVAAELLNKLIGRTSLDVDLRRAGDELGLDREQRQTLKSLPPGSFFAFGPALDSAGVTMVRTGEVHTTHPQGGMQIQTPPPAPPSMLDLLAHLRAQPLESLPVGEPLRRDTSKELPVLQSDDAGLTKRLRLLEEELARERHQRQEAEMALASMTRRTATLQDVLAQALIVLSAAPTEKDVLPLTLQAETIAPGPEAAPHDAAPAPKALPPQALTPRRPRARVETTTVPQQRILNALADFEVLGVHQVARHNLAVWADQSPRSSGFANNLGRLRALGLIDYPSGGTVALTGEGRGAAVSDSRPASAGDLLVAWKRKLKRPQVRILEEVVHAYPQALDRETLGRRSQQSPNSSGFANNLGTLRSLGLIDYLPGRKVVATSLIFLPQASA